MWRITLCDVWCEFFQHRLHRMADWDDVVPPHLVVFYDSEGRIMNPLVTEFDDPLNPDAALALVMDHPFMPPPPSATPTGGQKDPLSSLSGSSAIRETSRAETSSDYEI